MTHILTNLAYMKSIRHLHFFLHKFQAEKEIKLFVYSIQVETCEIASENYNFWLFFYIPAKLDSKFKNCSKISKL